MKNHSLLKTWKIFFCLTLLIGNLNVFSQTNIATTGVGTIWQDIPAALSTSNSTSSSNISVNDGNTATDIVYQDVNAVDNWQAIGIIWNSPQSGITSVKYYNGFTSDIIAQNGIFAANMKIQSTTDGSTWSDVNGWIISPSYPYNVNASNQVYSLSGIALNNILGIRVIGQLRVAASEYSTSWSIKVKEIEVFNNQVSDSEAPSIPQNLTATDISPTNFTLKWVASNDNVGVVSYDIFKDGDFYSSTVNNSLLISGLTTNNTYSFTVLAKDAAGNQSEQSNPISVKPVNFEGYRYLRMIALGAVSDFELYISEIDWLVDGEIYPKTIAIPNTSDVTATFNSAGAFKLSDNNKSSSSLWESSSKTYPQNLTFDLGEGVAIMPTGVEVAIEWNGRAMSSFRCEGSKDNQNWDILFAKNGLQESDWTRDGSKVFQFSNDNSDIIPPTLPTNLIASLVTQNSFTLNWGASTDNVGVKEYEIFLNGSSAGKTTNTNINLSELNPGTNYAVTVQASDDAGNKSDQSTVLQVSTQAIIIVPVNSISLNPNVIDVQVGKNQAISANILPIDATNKTVTWSTSNNAVALVNTSGVVLTLAEGTATITATTQDGNKTATAQITVSTKPEEVRTNIVGINLGNPGIYYDQNDVFTDAMKSSFHWTNGGQPANQDENYWPLEDANVIVFSKNGNVSGTYKLSFKGKADLDASGITSTIQNKVYNASTNTTTADLVIPNTGKIKDSFLSLSFNNTNRGVKDVKLMKPITPGSTQSYLPNQIFTNFFIDAIAPYKLLRSLGWVAVNWSQDSLWNERTLWSFSHQSPDQLPGKPTGWEGRGASWESLIMLANQTNKDVWITVPAKANDDYITKLAQLFKYGSDGVNPYTSTQTNPIFAPLNPNLKMYVEYSNEIWNGQFSQTGYCVEQALLQPPSSPINFDNEQDLTTLWFRFKAMRSVEISNIFRDVYGDANMMTTVRPLVCWQQAYSDLTSRTLSFVDRYYGKKDSRSNVTIPHEVNYYFYGGGGSGYWYSDGVTTLDENSIWTNGGWNPYNKFLDGNNNQAGYYEKLSVDAAWCKMYGISYLNYEGDAHPTYQNNDEAIMAATHWDPRMKQNTLDHLKVTSELDCEVFNFLSPGGSGDNNYWAVLNFNNEGGLGSPQWDAINMFINSAPSEITLGEMAPYIRDAREYDTPSKQIGLKGNETIEANTPNDVSYLFRVPKKGVYSVKFTYHSTEDAKIELQSAGNIIGSFNLASTNENILTTPEVNLLCSPGKAYSVRIIALNGKVTLHTINIGETTILPVTLASFSAKAVNQKAKIEFTTVTEVNNNYFVIEKSVDGGKTYEKLAQLTAKGSSSSYFAYDDNPYNGINYYRLLQYDLDGKSSTLGTKVLNFKFESNDISIYPNPSSGDLNVNLLGFEGKDVKVALYDLSGKTIHIETIETNSGRSAYPIHLKSKPSAGNYILQLTGAGLYKSFKISIK